MKLYITNKTKGINASGEYNTETNEMVVLKGSIISENVVSTGSFRGTKSILKTREGNMDGNVLTNDVKFSSPSTAANFVMGSSCNGLICWKDKNGKKLKEIINEGTM